MVKVLMGYRLPEGFSEAEHDHWLREIHLPDMEKVPGLKSIVLNRTRRIVIGNVFLDYVAELHYQDMDSYLAAREWIKSHPFSSASLPNGKLEIRFMIVCESDLLKNISS